MNRQKRKRASQGFTLVETLAALLILTLLIGVIHVGTQTAVATYQVLTFASESDMLASTVNTALSDMLRYAVYDKTEGPDDPAGQTRVLFTNENYGMTQGYLFLDDKGRIMVNIGGEGAVGENGDIFYLVNDGAYASMKITSFTLAYSEADQVFSGSYTIKDAYGAKTKEETFGFHTLKMAKRSDGT